MSAGWRVINPPLLDELPEGPGIFEIGNLVRSVLYVGAAPGGLAREIRAALTIPGLLTRAHCIRFEVADDAEAFAQRRLEDYRKVHAGRLPLGHRPGPLPGLASREPATSLGLDFPAASRGPRPSQEGS